MNRRNRAFTLLELIIVISIILVLMGMVILGVRKIGESSHASATTLVMENGRSMVAEYTRTAGAYPLPSQPLDFRPTILPTPYYPADLTLEKAQTTGIANANDRFGRITLYTRAVMGRMMQNAAIRKMIDALPSGSTLQIPSTLTLNPVMAVYPTTPPGVIPLMSFAMGEPGTGTTPYICIAAFTDSGAAPYPDARPRLGNLAQWHWLDLSIPAANLVDGYGNPLLFMPACGFYAEGRLFTSGGVFVTANPYWQTGVSYTANVSYIVYSINGREYQLFKCTGNHTSANANAPGQLGASWVRVPTYPFFASAGPDGVFYDPNRPETLDDNTYSFEN